MLPKEVRRLIQTSVLRIDVLAVWVGKPADWIVAPGNSGHFLNAFGFINLNPRSWTSRLSFSSR
jgi:hypothetical protein